MDRWKYFAITHHDHEILNPLSREKLSEFIGLLDLPRGVRVLDIGCGKGAALLEIVERCGGRGVGVDASPQFLDNARRTCARHGFTDRIDFLLQDGLTYSGPPESFDLAMCMGASWIFGGFRKTLRALAGFVKPGGLVVSGEPFAYHSPEVLALAGRQLPEHAQTSHAGNVAIGVDEGLVPLYTMVSSHDDWDRYQGLQWRAAERYALEHPDDPDLPEVLQKTRAQRDLYLRSEREELGWALYLFRK